MLVYSYFDGDNDEALKDLQYEMYSYSISTIFTHIKQIYLDNKYTILYLSDNEIEHLNKINGFSHHLLQSAHDMLAAVFRYKAKEGAFEKELFDESNDNIKYLFSTVYIDTLFLDNIPGNYWHIAYKWHEFIIKSIRNNMPLARELVLALFKFINPSENNKAKNAADRTFSIIKDQYNEIPWNKYRDNHMVDFLSEITKRENKIIEYIFYDYTEKCRVGYGGTAYYKGYITFYKNFLIIKDQEIDRDSFDDAWHGNFHEYYILSEEYPKILFLLNNEDPCNNIDDSDEIVNNVYMSLNTENEKKIFNLLITVIKTNKEIMHGGTLIQRICADKFIYYERRSQYDDFYPDCDNCNYDKAEIKND
jgi:hypothetical protein